MSAYANVYFKTTITKENIRILLIVGVPSSQALPKFLITAPPSVRVPEVIGVLAVWISNQKNKCRYIYSKADSRMRNHNQNERGRRTKLKILTV